MTKKPAYQDFDEWVEETERLQREGKLKPWSKHMQDKMDSSSFVLVKEAPPHPNQPMLRSSAQRCGFFPRRHSFPSWHTRDDASLRLVRARRPGEIEVLLPAMPKATPHADYPYRAVLPAPEVACSRSQGS